MTAFNTMNVLRRSTAQVQPRYRGKYPNRVRQSGCGAKDSRTIVLVSNDHRVLTMTYAEARAIAPTRFDRMDWLNSDIEILANEVAIYRNRMIDLAQPCGTTVVYIVTATHPTNNARFGGKGMRFKVTREHEAAGGKFYAVAANYGCGKSYSTAENAIRMLLADHACTVVSMRREMTGKIAREVMRLIECNATYSERVALENEQLTSSGISFAIGANTQEVADSVTRDQAVELPGNAGSDGVYSVAVYHVTRCYGGPEEGGWYYDRGEPSEEFALHLRMFSRVKAAVAYAAQLDATVCAGANEGRRELSSVLSDGRYRASVQDGYPAAFPQSRPYYE